MVDMVACSAPDFFDAGNAEEEQRDDRRVIVVKGAGRGGEKEDATRRREAFGDINDRRRTMQCREG